MGMFKHILVRAHHGDKEAVDKLYEQYKPLLRKYSFVNGVFDEDLHHKHRKKPSAASAVQANRSVK